MSVWTGRMGDSVDCTVFQEVLALWFSRTRARPGEKVKLGAIVKDVKDGATVKFVVTARGEKVGEASAQLQGGKCEAEWTIQLPARDWSDRDSASLSCTVNDRELNNAGPPATLVLDLALPKFSL